MATSFFITGVGGIKAQALSVHLFQPPVAGLKLFQGHVKDYGFPKIPIY